MTAIYISSDQMLDVLYNWNDVLRNRSVSEANFFEQQANERIQEHVYLIQNPGVNLLYYSTLARHNLLINNFSTAEANLSLAEDYLNSKAPAKHHYYYHLTKSSLYNQVGNFPKSLFHLLIAEEMLTHIEDDIEVAYFYYCLAGQYYNAEETITAARYLDRCQQIYESDIVANMEYQSNTGLLISSKILYGLNLIDLYQYEEAEEVFHEALAMAQRSNDLDKVPYIYHDLGLLYSIQGLSDESILYITKAIEQREKNDPDQQRSYFLLTKELYRSGRIDKAKELFQRGISFSEENDDREHYYKYIILNEVYAEEQKSIELLEEAIDYLIQQKRWLSVEEYADMIATAFKNDEDFEKASKFFVISLRAKHNHKKKVK
jgi:response regulator aspartate phosphatase C